ncbi:Myb-like protein P [Gracilariopsis chorda]|uniref:Myb-like protein P n=1 Tax=Gracilariopsis chorda TaxID=448386 RepID=A0A2V3IS49_9FLOR|nr:Myb-like protein P [Gracilariopsis chorda]|eukprot:PXF44567.1 Myb-like protein P [Gracilariopsis chorda]
MVQEQNAQDRYALEQSLQAVERSIQITEQAIERERSSMQHDRFGRRTIEMPPCLRKLYESSEWRNQDVYIWPTVLKISQDGHARAAIAENALQRLHYRPPGPIPTHPALADAAIKDAKEAVERVTLSVKKVMTDRRKTRHALRKDLAKQYMERRKAWIKRLDMSKSSMTEEQKQAARRRDREILMATRSSAGNGSQLTPREVDLIFEEIEAAGGTAGGLERWGRSITGIPDHSPGYLPPASDGGVLIEDPLAYHYFSRYINPWTRTEILLFLDKFIAHGKNFRRIASFFKHKTVEDIVRFYFDNKVRLNLKNLAKEGNTRKRGNKRAYLQRLAELPLESRSIKDNFIYQPDMFSDSDTEEGMETLKAEKMKQGALGRGWTGSDRQALIFALCRYDVSDDDESKPVPTVWSQIASAVGNKTPRQCRQFYFQHKAVLALDGYRPPNPRKRGRCTTTDSTNDHPQKVQRREKVLLRQSIESANSMPNITSTTMIRPRTEQV